MCSDSSTYGYRLDDLYYFLLIVTKVTKINLAIFLAVILLKSFVGDWKNVVINVTEALMVNSVP